MVSDDVAFEIRHRVESTIVMRLEILLPPFAKTMTLSRDGTALVRRNLCVESAPLWGQGVDALVVADESREPEVMSRGAMGSTAPVAA